MSDILPPAALLDQAVLAVPGVDFLYSAAPLVTAVITTAVEALTSRPASASSVLSEEKSGLSVAVKIGVSEGYAAADVCRRVHDAVALHLQSYAEYEVAEIAVTVARIG